MATLTTVDGIEIDFNPDNVAAVAPDDPSTGAIVYGVTREAVRIGESPLGFVDRLGIGRNVAHLTRPDGSPIWISGASASSLRAPLPKEYAANARAVVFAGSLTQAVEESVEAARLALNAHGGKL